jgi:hypothetical protein
MEIRPLTPERWPDFVDLYTRVPGRAVARAGRSTVPVCGGATAVEARPGTPELFDQAGFKAVRPTSSRTIMRRNLSTGAYR